LLFSLPVTILFFILTALKTEGGEAPSFTAPLRDRSIEDGSAARFDVRVRGKIEDAGQYKVVAKNGFGEVSSSATLFVEGVYH